MAKTPKLQVSNFMNSLKFCRPKDPFSLVSTPLPKRYMYSPAFNPKSYDISLPSFPDPPPSTPTDHHPSINIGLSPLGKNRCDHQPESSKLHGTPSRHKDESSSHAYSKNRNKDYKEKMYNSLVSSNLDYKIQTWSPSPAKGDKNMKNKLKANIVYTSISSMDSDDETNDSLFCSPPSPVSTHDHLINPLKTTNVEEEEPLNGSKKKAREKNVMRRFKRFGSKDWKDGVMTALSELSIDDHHKLPEEKPISGRALVRCSVDRKENNSFVVMKKSVDPYEDFKKSMLEMILEKQIFEPKELEQLLMSFLSLNSRIHHRVIIEAFTEIWKELFCGSSK